MKSYLDLVPICAKAHKRQNRMTLFCIAIAVFLVTSIFSMADMAVRMEKTRAIERHGNWHVQLIGVPESDAKLIGSRPDVAVFSRFDAASYDAGDCSIGGHTAMVCGADEAFVTAIVSDAIEGSYPQSEGEILLTSNAKAILGANIGDRITLKTPSGSFSYVITGFGGDAAYTTTDGIGAFLQTESFIKRLGLFDVASSNPVYYVRFKENTNSRKAIDDIAELYGLTAENLKENTALLGLEGFSSDSYVMGLYMVAAMLFVLILAAGIFMIAGSLNRKIAQRSQFFGMLRCIGASRAQIMRYVRLEALSWCKTAIPAGVLLGIVITWALCAVLRFGLGGEFADIPVFGVSAIGVLSGVVAGILSVLICAQAPAKRAGRTSPMAAASGNAQSAKQVRHAANTRFVKIETALGVHHAVSDKKNLILMTGSFALNIAMFLAFSTVISWTNQAIPSLRAWTTDLSIASYDSSCEIDKNLAGEIERMEGVKRAFGRMYLNIPAEYRGEADSIDLISYEQNQFGWAKEDVAQGDLSKALGDSDYVLTVFDEGNLLTVGDKIQLDGVVLEVAAVLETSPFSSTDTPTVICSEEAFVRITGKSDYSIVDIQLANKATDEDVNKIRTLAGEGYRFSDRRAANRELNGTYFMFTLFAYGFLAIISMITALNVVNSIAMSVSARTKQYGAMRAVGMCGRQITKMIAAETVTYVLSGSIAGCAVGLPLHMLLFCRLITAYWGTPWRMPLGALVVIALLVALASIAAVYTPAKRIRDMAINEL